MGWIFIGLGCWGSSWVEGPVGYIVDVLKGRECRVRGFGKCGRKWKGRGKGAMRGEGTGQ